MKKIIKEHNATTGQIIEREFTNVELAQFEVDKAEALARQEAEAAKAADKSALLERLGISEAEARLLLS